LELFSPEDARVTGEEDREGDRKVDALFITRPPIGLECGPGQPGELLRTSAFGRQEEAHVERGHREEDHAEENDAQLGDELEAHQHLRKAV
jgi:hypothetical protein